MGNLEGELKTSMAESQQIVRLVPTSSAPALGIPLALHDVPG